VRLDVTRPPTDHPWNVREMHVRYPDGLFSGSVSLWKAVGVGLGQGVGSAFTEAGNTAPRASAGLPQTTSRRSSRSDKEGHKSRDQPVKTIEFPKEERGLE
jgi:hypothetical protein